MQIGSLQLQDFEVPAWIIYGGNHRLVVHRTATGQRIIEDLGPDDSDLLFRGSFSGPLAESRARALNAIRLAATPVWITWNNFRYRVIVRSLQFQYEGPLWIHYSATCLILDQPGSLSNTPVNAAAQVLSDTQSALALAAGINVSLNSLASTFAVAVQAPIGSSARLSGILQGEAAQSEITTSVQVANNDVASFTTASGTGPDYVNNIVASAGVLCQGLLAQSYISRIASVL